MDPQVTILKFQCCHIKELSAIIVTAFGDIITNSTGAQQTHIVRCREFIFTDSNIIGFPLPDMSAKQFYLIFKKSKSHLAKLQSRLRKLNFQYSEILSVDHYTFNQAMLYTLHAHLAPQWNKVGHLLMQGRNVIFSEGKTNALSLDINMGDDGLKLIVSAYISNSRQISLYDLYISTEITNEFRYYPKSIISTDSINHNAIYVLPSYKKGMVASIHRSLPIQCPFESYQSLKRHWKNHYGYRLPEDEKQIYYFQIKFRKSSSIFFTYPSCCIRGDLPILNSRVDQREILQTFLHDLRTKMPTLFGDDLQLEDHQALFPTVNFTTCSLNINQLNSQKQEQQHTNLTHNKPQIKKSTTSRSSPPPEIQQVEPVIVHQNRYCSTESFCNENLDVLTLNNDKEGELTHQSIDTKNPPREQTFGFESLSVTQHENTKALISHTDHDIATISTHNTVSTKRQIGLRLGLKRQSNANLRFKLLQSHSSQNEKCATGIVKQDARFRELPPPTKKTRLSLGLSRTGCLSMGLNKIDKTTHEEPNCRTSYAEP